MKLLLDTHALLWWINPSHLLSAKAHAAIADEEAEILVSAVSVFEIATKHRIGKLPGAEALVADFRSALMEEGFTELLLTIEHAELAGLLPFDHRDPFDRLLIAQAQIEQAILVSNETLFDRFGVRRLW